MNRLTLTLALTLAACAPKADPTDTEAPADTAAQDSTPPDETGDSGPPDDSGDDSGGDTDGGDDLHGEAPAVPVPLPEFSVTAQDGGLRGREHLLGHPTVLWFYPLAGTGG